MPRVKGASHGCAAGMPALDTLGVLRPETMPTSTAAGYAQIATGFAFVAAMYWVAPMFSDRGAVFFGWLLAAPFAQRLPPHGPHLVIRTAIWLAGMGVMLWLGYFFVLGLLGAC
jgi:hypothetical protein